MDNIQEDDSKDYKEQAQYILGDLRDRYIMLQKPSWFALNRVMPFVVLACALAAMLSNCYIEPSIVVIGVIDQSEIIEGLRFRCELYELYGSAVVTIMLALTQYSKTDSYVYCALPWMAWTMFGMIFKEIPGLYMTCFRILRLSILHGVVLTVATAILVYMQYCLLCMVWKKNKLNLGKAIIENLIRTDSKTSTAY